MLVDLDGVTFKLHHRGLVEWTVRRQACFKQTVQQRWLLRLTCCDQKLLRQWEGILAKLLLYEVVSDGLIEHQGQRLDKKLLFQVPLDKEGNFEPIVILRACRY